MSSEHRFSVAAFLAVIAFIINSKKCPPLAHSGGYPNCTDYQNQEFDFIIVGAGPAGCVLANRLSKNPEVKVLLLESGKHPSVLSEIPLEYPFLLGSEFDYYMKLQQPNMYGAYKNNVGHMFLGRALGGGTSINLMMDVPGVPYDYNKWANTVQDPEWSYVKLEPYFQRVYEMVKTTNYTQLDLSRLYLALSAQVLGYSVNNPTDILGYHDIPVLIHEQTRNSMPRAYLKPIAARKNLCVAVERTVTKIIIHPQTKEALAVEIRDPNGLVYIKAKREIIVSAGAINSPKLLMLSGIGPKEHLEKMKIDIVEDLPVGRLRDHPFVPIYVQSPTVFGYFTHEQYIKSYCAIGFPLNTIGLTNFIGLINTKNETTHPNVEIAHIEFPIADKVFLPQIVHAFQYTDEIGNQLTRANWFTGIILFAIANWHPKSQGTVLLSSSDPKDDPIINGNYLSDPDDAEVLIDAILNVIVPMMGTLPFSRSKLVKFDLAKCDQISTGIPYYKSRAYWACYLKYFAHSEYHPSSTCRMGYNRSDSVVDSHFRVWGVQKLRVVDTSAMPITISGHPTVPVAMMTEKASDIILKDTGLLV